MGALAFSLDDEFFVANDNAPTTLSLPNRQSATVCLAHRMEAIGLIMQLITCPRITNSDNERRSRNGSNISTANDVYTATKQAGAHAISPNNTRGVARIGHVGTGVTVVIDGATNLGTASSRIANGGSATAEYSNAAARTVSQTGVGLGGAAVGGSIGSFAGPIGTIVGAVAGAMGMSEFDNAIGLSDDAGNSFGN